jgi:hypothetical protein
MRSIALTLFEITSLPTIIMKLSASLVFAVSLLPEGSLASWFVQGEPGRSHLQRRGNRCSFTLSSSGSFACPAGQLPDGQIRLNGTEDSAAFYISDGGITDSKGFGCIVTGENGWHQNIEYVVSLSSETKLSNNSAAPPTTQVQCDQGAAPEPHLTIDASGNLLYNGSPNFFACPATNTEYNIYVNPNFGQAKCFPITLQARGCGAATSCPPMGTSTVWQTQTVTSIVDTTVTITTTSACSSPTGIGIPPPVNTTTTSCHHCTKSHTSTEISSTVKTQ